MSASATLTDDGKSLSEDVPKAEEMRDLSIYVPEMVRKPGEIVFALMGVLLGVLGWYFALDMEGDIFSSPAVFSKMPSTVIIGCGLVSLSKAMKKSAHPTGSENALAYLLPKDVLVMLLMLLVYCIVLPYLHFIPSSYIFMVAGMIYLQRGKNVVLLALVLVFRYLFLVILP